MRHRFNALTYVAASALLTFLSGCGGGNTQPGASEPAPGADRTAKTTGLETGAAVMQDKAPVEEISMYLVGFHPSKSDPAMQMESHHYCDQVNEDFAQCVLYDGNTAQARLHGVEYIISEKLYATLPAQEKPYWHPHNYEILSGQLRLPGLPEVAENEALKTKINSYGKTWHFWKTGVYQGENDQLPLGPPHLAWSFNHDGEAKPGMVEARDERMNLDSAEARKTRAAWAPMARPQAGVDVLAGKFPDAKGAPDGVKDSGDTQAAGVPVLTMKQ
ncbi:MAG TPA: OBAP family protein [Vicinamibacterales bacterium]